MVNIKAPKAPSLPQGELDLLLGMKKQGFTNKQMNEKLITYRKDTTGKSFKNLTYIVSKVTSQTKRGEKERSHRTAIIKKYDDRKRQHKEWKTARKNITDDKKRTKFDKAVKKVVEQSKGEQHTLKVIYIDETDEWYFETQ